MWAAWTIGIRIFATGNAVGTFNQIASGAQKANAKTQALKKSINDVSRALQIGFGVAAAVGAEAMFKGIKNAADLQTAMVGVQQATQATTEQMKALRAEAYKVSQETAQSVVTSARVMQVMGRQGLTAPQILTLAEPVAKFADVQFLSRGVPFEQGATVGTTLAHLFRRYGTSGNNDIRPILDMATAMSMSMPHDLDKALTQLSYWVNQAQGLGIAPDQIMAAQVLLDRVGFGRGKGGTNIGQLINQSLGPLQLTAHAQKAKAAMLGQPTAANPYALGLLDAQGHNRFFHQGPNGEKSFDLYGELMALATWAKRVPRADDAIKILTSVFGVQGGRIAELVLDPRVVKQLPAIKQKLDNALPHMQKNGVWYRGAVEEAQDAYIWHTMMGQWQVMTTNFQSFLTTIMDPWLADLTTVFKITGKVLADWTNFMQAHPAAAKVAGGALAGGTVASALLAALAGVGAGKFLIGSALGGTPAQLATIFGAGNAARYAGLLAGAGWATVIIGGIAAVGVAAYEWRKHSKEIGHFIGAELLRASDWIHDTGGPRLVKAMQAAWTNGINGLSHADWGAVLRHALFGNFTVQGKGNGTFTPFGVPLGIGPMVQYVDGLIDARLKHDQARHPNRQKTEAHFHYHAAAGDDLTERRRAAAAHREAADRMGDHFSRNARTGNRRAPARPAPSHFSALTHKPGAG